MRLILSLLALSVLWAAPASAQWTWHIDGRIGAMAANARVLGPGQALLLGDSITEGFWWNQVCGGRQINGGIGWAGAVTLLPRVGEILSATQPAVVTVLLGINDATIQALSGRPIEEWATYYDALVQKIVASGATPVLLTILPFEARAAERYSLTGLQAMNAHIRLFASEHNYPLIDTYATFAGPDGYMPVGSTTDGVHLVNATYRKLYYEGMEPALTAGWARRGKNCSGL